MKVLTGGITELSTVDYPGHVASVLYLCGCPYRCLYCQNFALLDEKNCREVERVGKTLEVITQSGIEFEPRTTPVPLHMYTKEDALKIAGSLKDYGANRYVLQQFRPEGGCLDGGYEDYAPLPREYLLDIAAEVKNIIPKVSIRTKESGEENV